MMWHVRPYRATDFPALVQLQTSSFHTPVPFEPLNQIAKQAMRGEVGALGEGGALACVTRGSTSTTEGLAVHVWAATPLLQAMVGCH